jgi:hypothetical protein
MNILSILVDVAGTATRGLSVKLLEGAHLGNKLHLSKHIHQVVELAISLKGVVDGRSARARAGRWLRRRRVWSSFTLSARRRGGRERRHSARIAGGRLRWWRCGRGLCVTTRLERAVHLIQLFDPILFISLLKFE